MVKEQQQPEFRPLTGRRRVVKKGAIQVKLDQLDWSSAIDQDAIREKLKPQIEARLLAIAQEAATDWVMHAKGKSPVSGGRVKPGARGRPVRMRAKSEFSDPEERDRLLSLKGGADKTAYLAAYKFTKQAGLFKGRSPAAIEKGKGGRLIGFFAGQLARPGGTLRKSIHIESITITGPYTVNIKLVADAPYAAPVHEGYKLKRWKRGPVTGRPFIKVAMQEIVANLQSGRYKGM